MHDINFFKKNFEKKKILITGHTGFKGSWLAYILNELGAEVTGFALPPDDDMNHFSLLGLDKKINHIEGDINEENLLSRIINDVQPDFVFHLAAQALVRTSYEKPVETFSTNIEGTLFPSLIL